MKKDNLTFYLEKVLEVVIAFNSEKNYYDLLNVILDKMLDITNADAGTLYVVEDDKLQFKIMKTISLNFFKSAEDKIDLPPILLDNSNIENISAYSAIKNELVCIDDVYKDTQFNFSGPKNYDKITGYNTQSMLVFPLSTTENEVIGVIQLINAINKETGQICSFKEAYDLSILLALANISANTLANILYAREIDDLLNSFVHVMTKAIDERSVYNVNHTNNIAKYCDEFAEFLNTKFPKGHEFYFDDIRRKQLVMAAFLHDIGKIITPRNIMDKMDRLASQMDIIKFKFDIKYLQLKNSYILNEICEEDYKKMVDKLTEDLMLIEQSNTAGFLPDDKIEIIKKLEFITYIDRSGIETPILTKENMDALTVQKGTLTNAERKIMEEHVSITKRLLDNMKFNKYYKDVPRWASGHHELLDGSGYPLGLKGDEIELEICILSIIDIYDALTAKDRPYKQGLSVEKSHAILLSMVNEGKLHKELVNLFIESEVGGH